MRAVVLLVAALLSFALPALAADDVANAQSVIRAQERHSAATTRPRPIPTPRPASGRSFRRPTSSCRWSSTPTRRSIATRVLSFGEAQTAGGQIAQRVHIVDDNGEAWEALYTLEQQPDGSLKIIGCVLRKAGQAV